MSSNNSHTWEPFYRAWRKKTGVLLALWLLTMLAASGGASGLAQCPKECRCRAVLDAAGDRVLCVACERGGMRRVPVEYLDRKTQIISITAPPEDPNHLTIGPIFTHPLPFTELKELHIVHSNVPSIGQFSFWGLPNLKVLNLTHNNLTSIGVENFRGLINLTDLNLDYNRIDQMPSETFRHLTSLRTLTIAKNRITSLEPRLFRMVANLTHLDLSYNFLEDLNPEVFKDILKLKILKCRHCRLRRVNTQIYSYINNLEELDLGENQFKYLTSDEFISLKKLKRFKLDGNQLSVMVDHLFACNRELRVLSLARNRLALLAPQALLNLTALKHLDISHNKIEKFHSNTFIPLMDSLRTINLSGNNLPLHQIIKLLQYIPSVHSVGLANLSLEEIPVNIFSKNEHIVALDISWNKINKFPRKLLAKTAFLQRLDISNNKLEILEEEDLRRLEAISIINLSKNTWRCDQCSVGSMLIYMATTVLNETIRNLKCYEPIKCHGVKFGELIYEQLDPCEGAHEPRVSMIAGLVLLVVAVLAAGACVAISMRRRAQHYYTNEGKRRERNHEHPEELLGRSEPGSVATIHTPFHIVSKVS